MHPDVIAVPPGSVCFRRRSAQEFGGRLVDVDVLDGCARFVASGVLRIASDSLVGALVAHDHWVRAAIALRDSRFSISARKDYRDVAVVPAEAVGGRSAAAG